MAVKSRLTSVGNRRLAGTQPSFAQTASGADRQAVSASTRCIVDTLRSAVRAIFAKPMPVPRRPQVLILPGVRADD